MPTRQRREKGRQDGAGVYGGLNLIKALPLSTIGHGIAGLKR